jgi:hydrogenase/urease accessory protein HupE
MPLTLPITTAIVTIACGALVAAGRSLPFRLVVGCAVVLGLLHGSLNGSDLGRQQAFGLGIAGVAVALFAIVSLLAGQVASVRVAWGRIVVRVAGSWIAATGLLMLGWAVRGWMG